MESDRLRLSPKAARSLIFGALTGAGTLPKNAGYFADAILDTELSGLEAMASTGCSTIASMRAAARSTGEPFRP